MADPRLLLTRKGLVHVNYQYLGAYRLRVDASDPAGNGTDPNVFLYLQRPLNPYDGSIVSDLIGTASPVDMAEYPTGEPRPGTPYPIFRLSYLELDFRSTEQALHAWTLVVREVDALLRALDRLEDLVTVEEVWVGESPAEDRSASSLSGEV